MNGGWLTPRRRIVLLVALSWPVGYFYLSWAFHNLYAIVRRAVDGYVVSCDGWRDYTTSCVTSNPLLPIVEIVVVGLVLLGVMAVLARVVLAPLTVMAETVERLGPTSLGLRLGVRGPRDEARRLAAAIDAMLDRVAEGYEAQRRFAANASHELRTPLATQRALIEISLSADLSAEQIELLTRQLLATNERNEKLIEGLLVLAETDRGLITTQSQPLDAIVAETVELLRPTADRLGVVLEQRLAPVAVPGERPLLERLVSNLVGNAIKYNEPGGRVLVDVAAPGRLTVSNTGPLVPADQVALLFEPFRRGSGERLEHGGGVGLGLTIARSVVTAHHGAIEARANPGGGLTVEVRLPATGQYER